MVFIRRIVKNSNPTSSDIHSAFNFIFSNQSVNSTSYKFGFIKSILDNLYNVDEHLVLSFDALFSKFAESYWNLVNNYHLLQGSQNTKINQILNQAKEDFVLSDLSRYEMLSYDQKQIVNNLVTKECSKYVVGALFADSGELFYSFSKKEKFIRLNPNVYSYMCKYKLDIEKLNYYHWARYLEAVNSENDSCKLLTKLDTSAQRHNLSWYRDVLYNEFEYHTCFYCGKKLTLSHIHVDHFVPWSFVKDDKLWNFVLSCPDCNLRKTDKLPNKEMIPSVVDRNHIIIKSRPNYIDTNTYNDKTIQSLYNCAYSNGFTKFWQSNNFEQIFCSTC